MSDQTMPTDILGAPAATGSPAWGAVVSMMLGVFGLVTAEFLPASLLTPMATDLGVTKGAAGQAVTATAAMALFASLLVVPATRRIDRRVVLLGFSALLIASNVLAAVAPNLTVLLGARLLLGAALGGFWAMAAAVVMRLVPEPLVPRALSILFSGVSAATILAAPVGSYLGELIGWRDVMLIASAVGALALIVQFATLPALPPTGALRFRTFLDVATRPGVGVGILAIALVFTGHFMLFSFVRPYLEGASHVGISAVSGVLLGFGLANFVGTYLGGALAERSMRLTLVATALAMSAAGLLLSAVSGWLTLDAALVAFWGLAFGAVPVAWSTWLTQAVPDEAETAGGIMVAAIQLAIASGAAIGGGVFDAYGSQAVFATGGVILAATTVLIITRVTTDWPKRAS